MKMQLLKKLCFIAVPLTLGSWNGFGFEVKTQSPDGQLTVTLGTDASAHLQWSVARAGEPVILDSPLGVIVDGTDLGGHVRLLERGQRRSVNRSYLSRGVHARAIDRRNGISVELVNDRRGQKFRVDVAVFDHGVGLRYRIVGHGTRTVSGEATAFKVPSGSRVWFQENTANYEGLYHEMAAEAVPAGTRIGPPLTIELPENRGYAAITEAALWHYSGMTLQAGGDASCLFRAAFVGDSSWRLDGTITTPWRVVLVSPDLNGLVNADIITDLSAPPSHALAHAKWIRPGRAVWSWWSQGTGDLKRNERYVEQASRLGFQYNLVDAGWENWRSSDKTKWDLIKELVDYATPRHVGIWLWKHFSQVTDPAARRDFFAHCRKAGVVGVKIDFMDSESKSRIDFYQAALRDAAAAHLMVNFHGADKPTGEWRTWPNEMTREGIRGLEYNRGHSGLPPSHYATLPFTRYLAGPADFTPCTFQANHLDGTTFALQLASTIVFTSPLMHWAETPDRYLQSPAVDVIRVTPTVWDETRVLPGSRIGQLAAFARRNGDRWFVGIINGGEARSYPLHLDFLAQGPYRGVMFADKPGRPDILERSEKPCDAGEVIPVKMNAGGGFVAMLTPARRPGH
jgi:Glycoside hydrolase 97/Glycosyl-hydrolase 97 N-terminal/Glycosyl-hydrolase 97 C-terminal, oligomerisation